MYLFLIFKKKYILLRVLICYVVSIYLKYEYIRGVDELRC